MNPESLLHARIDEAAQALRGGAATSLDLVTEALQRIERDNAMLHALITIDHAGALAAARQRDAELRAGRDRGPLHGIPIVVKDTIDVEGLPTTSASPVHAGGVATSDAAVVRRLRTAGALVIGKTTTWELGCGVGEFQTASPWPEARNPVAPDYFAGGSSNGSAVAVAAGFAFGAVGGDTGGSIRSPAAACGIAGLKPSFGMVDREGALAHARSLDHIGPMARHAGDLAVLLAAMTGQGPLPQEALGLRGLRVGVMQECFSDDARLDPAVAACCECVLTALRDAGAVVQVRTIGTPLADWRATLEVVGGYESFARNGALLERPGRLSPSVHAWLSAAGAIDHVHYWQALARREYMTCLLQQAFAEVDFLVGPTSNCCVPRNDDEAARIEYSLNSANAVFNLSGHPAVSIPVGHDARGLPVGLQIAGRRGADMALLRFAAVVQSMLAAQ